MADCYECLHYEACSDVGDAGFSYLKDGEEKCDHFKNKADFVEVVRCKDCVWYEQNPWNNEEMVCRYYADWSAPEPGDFCSHGERRQE